MDIKSVYFFPIGIFMREIFGIVFHKLPEVDFVPKREIWNVYELADGSRIFFKIVVVKVFKVRDLNPMTGCPDYIVAYQNIVSVKSSERKEHRKPSFNLSRFADIPEEFKEAVEVKRIIMEDWNQYIVEGKYLYEIKPVILFVYKIKNCYDQFGYPVYYVLSQNVSRVRRV